MVVKRNKGRPGRPPKVRAETASPSGADLTAGPAVAQSADESHRRPEYDDWDWEHEEALDRGASLHASRDQETPSEEAIHEELGDWSPPSLLEAPPPRPGYRQRWIRVRRGNQDDWRNWNSRLREGWRPRDPKTVPRDYGAPTDAHGTFGSVIMVEGMILCEMDERRARQRQAFYARKLATQTQAVDDQLLKVQQPGHPIRRDAQTRVTVGARRPNVQDDDAA